MDEDLFGILLVFKAQFVKAAAAGTGAGLEHAHCLVAGEAVGGHHVGVIDAADDDRLIGIPFFKSDDDFVADTGNGHEAKILSGPGDGTADPAGAGGVVWGGAIPEELDFDATVLVGVDFLAGGADDNRGLGAVDNGLGGDALGAEGERERDAVEDDLGRGSIEIFVAGVAAHLRDGEMGARQDVSIVVFVVAVEREFEAGGDAEIGRIAGDVEGIDGFLLHADLGGPLVVIEDFLEFGGLGATAGGDAVKTLGVAAGIIVEFHPLVTAEFEFVSDLTDLDGFDD